MRVCVSIGHLSWGIIFLDPVLPESRNRKPPKVRRLMTRFAPLLAILVMTSWIVPAFGDEPGRPLKIVVFGGHPDDPESAAGGLIATLTRQGHDVICAYGTAFRKDRRFFNRPEADVRREEATAACKILGASPKFFSYSHESLVADATTLSVVSAWLDETSRHRPDSLAPRHSPNHSGQFSCLAVLQTPGGLEPLLLRGHDRPATAGLGTQPLPRYRSCA